MVFRATAAGYSVPPTSAILVVLPRPMPTMAATLLARTAAWTIIEVGSSLRPTTTRRTLPGAGPPPLACTQAEEEFVLQEVVGSMRNSLRLTRFWQFHSPRKVSVSLTCPA